MVWKTKPYFKSSICPQYYYEWLIFPKNALFSHQNDLISETFGTQKPAEFTPAKVFFSGSHVLLVSYFNWSGGTIFICIFSFKENSNVVAHTSSHEIIWGLITIF